MENTFGLSPPKLYSGKVLTLQSTTNIKFQTKVRKYILGFFKGVVGVLDCGSSSGDNSGTPNPDGDNSHFGAAAPCELLTNSNAF